MPSGDQQAMDVASLRRLAAHYLTEAGNCANIGQYLTRMHSNLYWKSNAAQSFSEHMQNYTAALQKFHDEFTSLSKEVSARADLVEQSQQAVSG